MGLSTTLHRELHSCIDDALSAHCADCNPDVGERNPVDPRTVRHDRPPQRPNQIDEPGSSQRFQGSEAR